MSVGNNEAKGDPRNEDKARGSDKMLTAGQPHTNQLAGAIKCGLAEEMTKPRWIQGFVLSDSVISYMQA